MELPPYRIPTIKGISIHVFERTWLYLKKAGTVILGISVVLWAMMYFPVKEQFDRDYAEERAQAEQTYQDRIANWHSQYGIPFDAQKMVQAMGERREENREDDSFAIGDPDLTRFLSIYQAIEEVWETFDQTVEREGVEKNTLDHALLVRVRDSNLAKIEKREPEFFPAAIHYIDTIEQPYTESLLSLQRAKHAEKLSYSLAGRVGKFIEPALIPLGFDWKIGTALIGAFAAKEVFIAQLGIVYSLGESEEHSQVLREQLQDHYTPLAAFCIMLFCLIALPCMATFAATRLESGSWKWAFFQFFSLTSAGYLLTLIVYQSGRFLGIGL